jgi:hypothetical protein
MGKTIAAVIIATALAVSGWTYAIARPATVHNVSHTVTRVVREPSATRTVIKWKTRTVTRTVTQPASGNAGMQTCIDALYSNIQGWYANEQAGVASPVPNGWWTEQCVPYTP